jgi:hypothetical protein
MVKRTIFAALTSSSPPHSSRKSSPHARDAYLMKRVGTPSVSPDGRGRFLVTEPSYDDKNKVDDLWVVPSDGSANRARSRR